MHDQAEYPGENFTEFPCWDQPSRPRKDSFVDLMPQEHCFSDSLPCLEGAVSLVSPNDVDVFDRFLTPFCQDISEISSADSIELPKQRKKTVKRGPVQSNPIASVPLLPETRQVGPISTEERRKKIERYLEKRRKRTWGKKICYDCRKRVADHRLRVKGRFVTKEQAVTLLGPEHVKLLLQSD